VLSGRGLCDELITRPEESYRLCCVVVCDLETSRMGAPYIYDISHLRVKLTDDRGNTRPYTKPAGVSASILSVTSQIFIVGGKLKKKKPDRLT